MKSEIIPPSLPRYSWQLLRAGPIKLDGGGMFGVVPRAVWSRAIPPDESNRIELAHNCLLLRRGGETIVIETGSGNKLGPKMRKIFALTDRWLIDALAEADCQPQSVNHVVVSHLHFDHAGGLTRAALPDEKPDWTRPEDGSGDAPAVVRTFPNADVIVQKPEWEDALVNRSVMTRTYLPDHLEPIREHLRLIDSPLPFPPGKILTRGDLPDLPLHHRETEVLPGIFAFLVPGHTWGQQAIRFTDESGRNIVFIPDVMPTVHHAAPAYSLAYDVEPYVSMITRHWLLEEAAANDWLLVLDHEPKHPLQRVRRDGRGWFTLLAEVDQSHVTEGAYPLPRYFRGRAGEGAK